MQRPCSAYSSATPKKFNDHAARGPAEAILGPLAGSSCRFLHLSFGEFTFRNCLESDMGPASGPPNDSESSRGGLNWHPLPPKMRSREAVGYFPNSFSTHFGA